MLEWTGSCVNGRYVQYAQSFEVSFGASLKGVIIAKKAGSDKPVESMPQCHFCFIRQSLSSRLRTSEHI